jgi:hypothetical protein
LAVNPWWIVLDPETEEVLARGFEFALQAVEWIDEQRAAAPDEEKFRRCVVILDNGEYQ